MKTKYLIIGLFLIFVIGAYFFIQRKVKNINTTSTPIHKDGDLLSIYGEKPQHLKFKEIQKTNTQVSYKAYYEVEGKHSKEVENFLVNKYQMGKLKWACCGYENTNGKKGEITVNLGGDMPSFDLSIGMRSNDDHIKKANPYIPKIDREKLHFIVTVSLIYHKDI